MSAMGGNLGMFGDFGVLNTGPTEAMASPNNSIAGVGIDPEGIDQNPAYYHFLLETAWRSSPINTTTWLQHWGMQRCGRDSAKVAQAWAILANTVYAHDSAQVYEVRTTHPGNNEANHESPS